MKLSFLLVLTMIITGCSVLGNSDVATAPYKVIEADEGANIELRHYDQLVLVTAPMQAGMDTKKNKPFSKLFDYISGENVSSTEIRMTSPVLFSEDAKDKGVKIPMTAPVFMEDTDKARTMSFVLPTTYTINTAPLPKDPELTLEEINDTTYAVIQFSGLLNANNINKHRAQLEQWIASKGLKTLGSYKAAGYNPPFTIPSLRRNEVLIPVMAP